MSASSLKSKTALVTGSTSGIGLGVARSLAAEGANIVFNGFGDRQEIQALQTALESEFGVKTAYHNADMILMHTKVGSAIILCILRIHNNKNSSTPSLAECIHSR